MKLVRPDAYQNNGPNIPWWDTYAVEFDTIPIIEQQTTSFPQVCISGAWKTVTECYICIGGAWKPVTEIQVVSSSAWKSLTS